MAPSPRKQVSSTTTPQKISKSTPTKGTRTSPRKKAWGSPSKSLSKNLASQLFKESDFSPLSNKSWAEITEDDDELNDSLRAIEAERRCKSESRRKGAPRKLAETKPKFVRCLELTNAVFSSSSRKSTRIGSKNKDEKASAVVETKFESKETIMEKASTSTTSRKRCLSNASTINEEVSPSKRRQNATSSGKPLRKAARALNDTGASPARVRLGNSSSAGSVPGSPSSRKDHWEQPTLGWCTDDAVLKRRSREVERAKEKSVYQKYVTEIPIRDRVKNVHPRTPNKMINFSRRSWDTQIRNWKRSLYDWAGEEPSDSVNTSFCSYSESDDATSGKEDDNLDLENTPVWSKIDIPVRPEPDAMASLLGKFDMDSRMGGDESTLKASNPQHDPSAPVDFSHM